MRIALVTPGFSADDDDWCIPALQDLARHLAACHDVHVFATTYPHRIDEYRVKGIRVSSFGDGTYGRLALFKQCRRTRLAIQAAHRERPFDVLHGFWTNQGGLVTRGAARRLSLPNIVTVMGGELTYAPLAGHGKRTHLIDGPVARFGALGANRLVVNSNYHANRIRLEQGDLEPVVVPFGTEGERFRPSGEVAALSGDVPVVCAASLVRVKCHAQLLEALAVAAREVSGLHLHLLGEGVLEASLREQARSLGIAGRVTFHGHVEHHRLPQYYRAARFCVLASCFEGHGMVILEAAACGRVTVGTAVGSMSELCPDDLLSTPGDVGLLADSIRQLASDPERARDLGLQAAATVSENYRMKQTAQAMESLYLQTLHAR